MSKDNDFKIANLEYYDYLVRLMRIDLPEHRMYKKLMRQLWNTPFIVVVPFDENRVGDALDLRDRYFRDDNIGKSYLKEVSCLEVLAALSKRIEIEIMGEPGNDKIERWFWEMLDNLGVTFYDDEHYDYIKVDKILKKWLYRRMTKFGKGGIFPLKKVTSDQRRVEMWYQMQSYLTENYAK